MLETWDDRVCEFWVAFPPDRNHLNCEEWLLENKLYQTHMETIDKLISDAYAKIDVFYEQYIPYLQHFWENKRCGLFQILKNEKLHNPIESINMLL